MHGNDGRLTSCFVVVFKRLHVLRNCFTDAGTSAPSKALSQLIELLFLFLFLLEQNNKDHSLIRT